MFHMSQPYKRGASKIVAVPLCTISEEKAGMQEIICSRIGIKRLAPVMIDANQSSVKYNGQSIWCINGDHIHYPDRKISKCCSKSEISRNSNSV